MQGSYYPRACMKARKSLKSIRNQDAVQKASQTPEEVKQRIAEAAASGATALYLSNFDLTEVPEEIRQLASLEKLWLDSNRITKVPGWLAKLPRLKYVSLVENPLTSLPDRPNVKIDWEVYLRVRRSPLTPVIGLSIQLDKQGSLAKMQGVKFLNLAEDCPNLQELLIQGKEVPGPKSVSPSSEVVKIVQDLHQCLCQKDSVSITTGSALLDSSSSRNPLPTIGEIPSVGSKLAEIRTEDTSSGSCRPLIAAVLLK